MHSLSSWLFCSWFDALECASRRDATTLIGVASPAGRIAAISLGVVAALIAVVLWVASRSKWGQNKPLTKCIALAVLAHVWLLMYAHGTRIQRPGIGPGTGGGYSTTSNDFIEFTMEPSDVPELQVPSTLEPSPEKPSPSETAIETPHAIEAPPTLTVSAPPVEPVVDADKQLEPIPTDSPIRPQGVDVALSALQSTLEVQQGLDQKSDSTLFPKSVDQASIQPVKYIEPSQARVVGRTTIQVAMHRRVADQQIVPEVYQLRFSESRSQLAGQLGGDESTEAAVEAALRWLASVQEYDGSWDAAKYGAGRETRTLDRDRQGTGSKSDTGMAALALLSFLGAGYTHDRGPYTQVVASGVGYLITAQMPSGDLAGPKQIGSGDDVRYARMYCHGMATLALAEAYAMTGDRRLLDPIQRAAAYTLRAQNPQTGGWRYQSQLTGDPGDLSQFGWQAMALSSCEHAGIGMPTGTQAKMTKFLDSVAAGRDGGLAVYRPVPGQSPTTAMTAEAFAMRMLLNHPLSVAGQQEANRYLLQNLPGTGEENLYYWYYATLALFQQQDDAWRIWNDAIKTHLTSTQVVNGSATGSWDPRCIWAGYGGRIYSTTMSCLCLEVYYRYLPIYQTGRMANQPLSGWR